MDPATASSLSALRDIHLPGPVSLWPLAAGWWLLGGILLLVAVGAARVARARCRRQRAWQEAAAEELTRIETAFAADRDAVELAASLSALLRRSVLARFPERKIAALRGEDWFEFLCHDAAAPPGAETPDPDSLRLVRDLTHSAYAGVDTTTVPPDEWIVFVRSWIRAAA